MDKFREYALKPSWLNFDEFNSPQQQGVERPAYFKEINKSDKVVDLPSFDFDYKDFYEVIKGRRSVRKYKDQALPLDVLSYLLDATQGLKNGDERFRAAPSAGARHAIDTYIYASNIENLEVGLYRYHPKEHVLVQVHGDKMDADTLKREWFNAPCVFMWTAVPYRMAWRYAHCAEKCILLDAGHIAQNLYLACESIGYGTCAVGAYDQDKADDFLRVDGEEEFLIYASPLGKK